MEGGAGVGFAASYRVKHAEASPPMSPGGGRGKTVGGEESRESKGSGVSLPGGGALGCPAPTGSPQQQLSGGDAERGEVRLWASTETCTGSSGGTAAVIGIPRETMFKDNLEPAAELLSFVEPLPAASWRRRSILCGRTIMATLRFAWSTATATATLVGALLAALVFFWALSPVCTSCVRSSRQPRSAALATASAAAAAAVESGWSTLHINQLQVIGTHNSYHRRTYVPALGEYWDYHYPSLTAQLDAGIRHLELDIHYDWKTGRWFVFHLSVLDPMSSCNCLSVCLEEIREWSDAHPAHHILFIEIELKLTGDFLRLCGQKTPDADHTAFRAMQETVVSEFPASRILIPRQVRGDYETLTEAINIASSLPGGPEDNPSPSYADDGGADGDGSGSSRSSGGAEGELKGGWPLVDDTRGMVLFIIDYQSTNVHCRPAVREALPPDDTVFFERTPIHDVAHTSLLAFAETGITGAIHDMVRSGVIVRDRIGDRGWDSRSGSEYDEDGPRPSYIVDTPAQLVAWNDLRAVEHKEEDKDDLPYPLPCRSRCSAIVPEEQCILEGFC